MARHRWWVLGGWLVIALTGGYAAPRATAVLSFDFGLPSQPAYEANRELRARFGGGGDNPPLLLVVDGAGGRVDPAVGRALVAELGRAVPGARVASFADDPALVSRDGRTGVILVHPRPVPGGDPFAAALPAVERVADRSGGKATLTGQAVLQEQEEGGGGGAEVLAETLFGGIGALVVLLLVFGSALALAPLVIAAASILGTFLILWGLTRVTEVSFIVQYLLALIGLGVAIDYALLVVTRWREERLPDAQGRQPAAQTPGAHGRRPTQQTPDTHDRQPVERALATAGRSVLFSGVTVAVSLAALIALPVPFLRSVGFTGLLIPLVSVAAALTLLPALLLTAGRRLEWPHRRSADPVSRLWRRVATVVVRHRWVSALGATLVLLALAAPVLGMRLGQPTAASLASAGGGPAAQGVERLRISGLGEGLLRPVEVLTPDPAAVRAATAGVAGVAGAVAPPAWQRDGRFVVDVWTAEDTADPGGARAAEDVREAARATGAEVGGAPAQDADFLTAVYGNALWVVALIVVVTFLLLARALRSVWLPVKALVLNVLSLGAAYGVTVLIWQHGVGTEVLFDRSASGAIPVWVPIAVFAFLFGLSMDYEVFLLSRIREEYDAGHDTDRATVQGVARTGRLVSSAALILFLAFVALSRVPTVEVKILATALALGIVIDATIVRGVLAPALVALLGPANWYFPAWFGRRTPAGPAPDRS
ncbi:MMPL family transporter [Streptomyces sp. NPDC088757]|uniref:MMPL family transporter n=1 Tax=Streptomyces sp. NPDC088757 TaxID=3365889 RepID=UPI0037F4ECE6